jgi:O-antigen ligase
VNTALTTSDCISGVRGARLARLRECIALFGIMLAAAGTTTSAAATSIGLPLAFLLFLSSGRGWHWARAMPLFWVSSAAIVYIAVRSYLAAKEIPVTAELQYEHAGDWVTLFLFVPVAWWLQRKRTHIYWVAFVFALGLAIGTLVALNAHTFHRILFSGARYGGMLDKPITYAFYLSVGLIGIIVWMPRWLSWCAHRGERAKWLGVAALVAVASILFFGFLASKSRGPLFALLIVMPFAAAFRYGPAVVRMRKRTRMAVYAGLVLCVLALVGVSAKIGLLQRGEAAVAHVEQVTEEGLDETALNNVTYRLRMWRFGIEQWRKRPVFGWGPGSIRWLQVHKGGLVRHRSGATWDHLHSAYVQTLVSFGLIGVLLVGATLAGLVMMVVRRYREGRVESDDAIFIVATMVLILLYSLTDFRHLNHDWRAFWVLFGAVGVARGALPVPKEGLAKMADVD